MNSNTRDASRKHVSRVLRDLGLREQQERSRFQSSLRHKYGESAKDVLVQIERKSEGEAHTVYEAKNASADLSLAVASQFFSPVYEAFLVWLVNEYPTPPKRILDLGCEAGLLSLAIKLLWPESEVVGIDLEPKAIEVAREIAGRHKVGSCDFHVADLTRPSDDLGTFDLVLCVVVMHEVLGDPAVDEDHGQAGFALEATPRWGDDRKQALQSVKAWVKPDGQFVAVDRWPSSASLFQWITAMEEAGWSTYYARSYNLRTIDRLNGNEVLPLTVHHPHTPSSLSSAADVLALGSYLDFQDEKRFSYSDAQAEAIRSSMTHATRVLGAEATYRDGSGTERIEILVSGALACIYVTSSRGFRFLRIGPLVFLVAFSDAISEFSEARKPFADVASLPPDGDTRRLELHGLSLKTV